MTYALEMRCSIQLSYGNIITIYVLIKKYNQDFVIIKFDNFYH